MSLNNLRNLSCSNIELTELPEMSPTSFLRLLRPKGSKPTELQAFVEAGGMSHGYFTFFNVALFATGYMLSSYMSKN
jgi:hypothetical protein